MSTHGHETIREGQGHAQLKSHAPLGLLAPPQTFSSFTLLLSLIMATGLRNPPEKGETLARVQGNMPPLTIACLPIAQPSFLQDSLAGKAFVGKGLAGAHAGLQASPAVLGAVAPSRPRVPTTWAKSRKALSASVLREGRQNQTYRPYNAAPAKAPKQDVFECGRKTPQEGAESQEMGEEERNVAFSLTSLQPFPISTQVLHLPETLPHY